MFRRVVNVALSYILALTTVLYADGIDINERILYRPSRTNEYKLP